MSASINDATTVEIGLDPAEKSVEDLNIWSLRDVSKKSSQICFILSKFTNSLFKYDRLPDDKTLTVQNNSPRPNKYEWCDGIRGIAAFVVLFHHIQCTFFGEGVNAHVGPMYLVPLELLTRGQQAVHLFFVLSGFVLSVSFIAKLYNVEVISDSIQDDDVRSQKMKDVQYSGFLSISSTSCRRFARLFVPCFISGWIAFLSTEILNTHVDCAKLLNSDMLKDKGWLSRVCRAKASDTESTLLWKYIQIATIKVWDGGSVNPYNRAMWTMHVELAGSAIVMFTLLMVANIRWRYRTAALIAAFMFTFNASADQTTNDYSSFYSGMLIAQLIVYPPLVNFSLKAWRPQWLGVEWYGVVLQSGFAILGMYLLSVPYGADNGENRYSWVLKFFKPFGLDVVKAANRIGALIFMLVLAFSPGMQRFLTHRVFRFMGRISFLLYLLHFEVLMTVGVPVAYTMDIHDVLPYEHARYVASAVCVVVSVVAGYFATILIDEPVQRGLRLFEKRLKIVAR